MTTTEPTIASRPEDVGIDSEKLEAVFARAKRDVDDGIIPGCQVAVAREGRLAGFRSFGTAVQGGAEKPVTQETLFTIFSSTKAIVAAGVWRLLEEGKLRIEERVAEIIPEFGTNGKEGITVEQVMLHIGGFPYAPFAPLDWDNRERRLQRFAQWRVDWEPGTRFEYHASSAHWVLAEIIERRTGQGFREYLRERVIAPSGAGELYVGLPSELNDRVADVMHAEPPTPPPGGWGEVTPDAILNFNRPEIRAVGVPGGGGVGTAAALALFYQPLINGGVAGDGTRLLERETIAFATTVRTKEFHTDPILGHPINRALAVVVAGSDGNSHLRGMGRTVSPRAFGHNGAGGQIAWGDPETGISLGYTTHGFLNELATGRRTVAISSLAAACAKD